MKNAKSKFCLDSNSLWISKNVCVCVYGVKQQQQQQQRQTQCLRIQIGNNSDGWICFEIVFSEAKTKER